MSRWAVAKANPAAVGSTVRSRAVPIVNSPAVP